MRFARAMILGAFVLGIAQPVAAAPVCSVDVTLSKEVDGPLWFHSDIIHGEAWGACANDLDDTHAILKISGPDAAVGAGSGETVARAVAEALCWVGVYTGEGNAFTGGAVVPAFDIETFTVPVGMCKVLPDAGCPTPDCIAARGEAG